MILATHDPLANHAGYLAKLEQMAGPKERRALPEVKDLITEMKENGIGATLKSFRISESKLGNHYSRDECREIRSYIYHTRRAANNAACQEYRERNLPKRRDILFLREQRRQCWLKYNSMPNKPSAQRLADIMGVKLSQAKSAIQQGREGAFD